MVKDAVILAEFLRFSICCVIGAANLCMQFINVFIRAITGAAALLQP
jgi:hypothetical protein